MDKGGRGVPRPHTGLKPALQTHKCTSLSDFSKLDNLCLSYSDLTMSTVGSDHCLQFEWK